MDELKKPYKVTVNDCTFFYDESDLEKIDLLKKSPAQFHCINNDQSVHGLIENCAQDKKTWKVTIEGELFSIIIKDALDQEIEIMGFGEAKNKLLTNIRAPMPGLVLEIAVNEGQAVTQGEKIIILEAMKMENSLVIPANATIKKILVTKGQAVDKGQILVELEP